MYIADLQQSLAVEVEGLQPHEREAVLVANTSGEEWDCEEKESREPNPVPNTDEIVEYLTQEYVLAEAGRWSNRRIRAYLERLSRSD